MNKKCPDKIYLQVCDECYEETMKNAPDEITWCADQMDHANELCNGDGHVNVYDEESDTFSDLPLDMAYIREDIYNDLLRRIKELYQNIKNDNIECPDATEYTHGARVQKTWVLDIFDVYVPEAKEAQDDAD